MCYFGKGVWDVPPNSPVGEEVGGAESVGVTTMELDNGCACIHCVCMFETFPINCFLNPDWFDYKVTLFPVT